MLKPVREPVFKSENPDFNHKAAKWAYELVMKMDEDSAREFVYQVTADVLEETIEKNQRTLQKHLDEVISKRITLVKRAALRATVAKREGATEFAKALALIEKAGPNPYDYGYRFRESDFNRDAGSGQFRTKIRHDPNTYKPLHDKQAAAMGIPEAPRGLSSASRKQFQDEYRQLAAFLGSAAETDPSGDVMLHVRNKSTGQTFTVVNDGTRPNPSKWNPKTEQLVGATMRPTSLQYGGAAFGLTSALGADHETSGVAANSVNELHRNLKGFSDSWGNAGDLKNSNERLYNRVQSGSQILGQVAPNGSKVQIAAKFGEFVGEHGAEAEKVIGPTARKTAYRYRGTEKKPDPELVHAYGVAVRNSKTQTHLTGRENAAPQQIAQARQRALGRTPSWSERDGGRAEIQQFLQGRLPKAGLYNLQLASGNTPPSEGVIINANGQIATQAIGYGDDHYLPFNLKNLKSLKGGEYIRTRSVGGPTSEDIYTGLVSGARQVTVVSRSGTFKVTFEDDFRGGRRHNDKARRMVRRYEQILNAVQSEQVDREQIKPEYRNAIVAQVRAESGGLGLSNLAQATEIQRRIEEFKSSPELSEHDEKLAQTIATSRSMHEGQGRDAEDYMHQVMNELAAEKEYKFRLNGIGYEGALNALQEQFPYYIKVDSVPNKERERVETGLDYGYVAPGRNRPSAAAAGLFGTKHQQQYKDAGKFSAADADYQIPGGTLKPVESGSSAEKEGEKKDGEKSKKSSSQIIAEEREKLNYQEVALNLQKEMQGAELKNLPDKDQAIIDLPAAELMKPENQKRFNELARVYARKSGGSDAARAYLKAAGHLDQQEWDDGAAGVWGDNPRKFPGEAYQMGAPKAAVRQELRNIDTKSRSGIVTVKPLSAMTDAELHAEHAALAEIRVVANSPLDIGAKAKEIRESGLANIAEGAPGMNGLLENPAQIDERLKLVQQARALLARVPEDERHANSEALDPGEIIIGNSRESGEARVNAAKARVLAHAQRADMLARHLENVDADEDTKNAIRAFADNAHNAIDDIHSDAEADAWVDRNQRALRFLTEQEKLAAERARAASGSNGE